MQRTAIDGSQAQGRFLNLTGVSVRFGETLALNDVTLAIDEGEFVAVVGPSGCGKSTLMHVVAGFVAPSSGSVSLNGRPITAPGAERTVMLQQPTLFPWLDVKGNVELGPKARGVPKAVRERSVRHYLELVELWQVRDSAPYELSGGMQQRVSLARALANDASILLIDEPFGALDALTRDNMQNQIVRIWQETGKTIFLITHDVEEAVFCATSIITMKSNPGEITDRIMTPFSARLHSDLSNSRELRSDPDFIRTRERVLANVIGTS